jgi:hypothetical protein
MIRVQEETLRGIVEKHKNSALKLDQFSALSGALFQVQQQIQKGLKDLADIGKTFVLEPTELYHVGVLKLQLGFQLHRAELYSTELSNFAKDDDKWYFFAHLKLIDLALLPLQ